MGNWEKRTTLLICRAETRPFSLSLPKNLIQSEEFLNLP